jgi:hypothetical protein
MEDFVKPVAAAYGSGDPDLHQIGSKALAELAAIRGEARTQEEMIRQLLGRAPKADPVVKPPAPAAPTLKPQPQPAPNPTPIPNGHITVNGKLDDEMKEMIRELWTAEYRRSQNELTAQEVVDRLAERGFKFGHTNPTAVVGTVIHAAKRRVKGAQPQEVA